MTKNIISFLAEHDWYYPMSDDPTRYRQGLKEEQDIRNELMKYKMENVLDHLDLLKERVTKLYNQK
jgi:hypothetical protein